MSENEGQYIESSEESSNDRKKPLLFDVLKIAFFICGVIVFVVFQAPMFFDNSALKAHLSEKVSQSLKTKFLINGDVKVAFLPTLSITAKDVVIEDLRSDEKGQGHDIFAKNVKIEFPIFGKKEAASIRKIIINEALMIRYEGERVDLPKDDDVVKKFAEISKSQSAGEVSSESVSEKFFSADEISKSIQNKFPEVEIEDAKLVIFDKFNRKKEFNSINAKAEFDSNGAVSAKGDFVSKNLISDFDLKAVFNSKSAQKDSHLIVKSPALELNISGNFLSQNRGIFRSDFVGNMSIQILELKSFYQTYISDVGVVATRLKINKEPIKVSAEITNENGELSLKNIQISSDVIGGKGDAFFDFSHQNLIADLSMDFDLVDLENLWTNEVVDVSKALPNQSPEAEKGNSSDQAEANQESAEKTSDQPVEIAKPDEDEEAKDPYIELTRKVQDVDFVAEIKIKKIKYLRGEIVDTSLYLNASQTGDIMVMPAIFNVPGQGLFRISGVFDNSTAISKFVGEFDGSGKSLKDLILWLDFQSQNLKIDALGEYNFRANLLLLPNSIALNNLYLRLNNSDLLGEVKFENDGKAINSSGKINLHNFSVDDHFLVSGQNSYLSPGSLLKKLFWLNQISATNSFQIGFDHLTYKSEKFSDDSFKIKTGRGYIEISDLDLKSDQTDLKADFAVDISDRNPRFKMIVDANKFHYESPESKEAKFNIFDQFYALPSLEGFNGELKLNLVDAKIEQNQITNTKFGGAIKDGNIEKAEIDGEVFGGKLSYRGALGLKISKTLNGNLGLSNVDLGLLFSDLFGVNNISGVANISANLTSIANNSSDFAKTLKSEAKFSVSAPVVDGYGLSDLVKMMFQPKLHDEQLRQPEKILFGSDRRTVFSQATGTYKINDGQNGLLKVDLSAPAINSILSGKIFAEGKKIDLLFNTVFLTGTKQKQVPINIATSLVGAVGGQISQSTNSSQISQYLGHSAQAATADKTSLVGQ